jgi:integrase
LAVKILNLEGEEPLLAKWLTEFKSYNTQKNYRTGIRKFKKVLGIDSLEDYLNSNPDTEADVRKFLQVLDERPSKTVSCYTQIVKVFLQDHGVKVPEEAWKKIRRRGFMPKRIRAETRDKKPTKAMLKKILNYSDLKARALFLYLVSSGSRIGETLQLKKEDLDLEADPPKAHIRREYTKGGVGERTVFFSYEARDAIKDWLQIKDDLTKRGNHGDFSGETVFPLNPNTVRWMWNHACDKAGLGIKDKRTGRRVYHIHSLRKYFRTKIGLDLDIVSALMGHVEGLDKSYVRLDQDREIARAYKEAMPNVSVYEMEDQELKQETESLREENEQLKKRIEQLESVKTERNGDVEELKKENRETKQELKQLSKTVNVLLKKLENLTEK